MGRAISAVEDGGMGHREAAKMYKISRKTLSSCVHLNNPDLAKHGNETLLDWDTERLLVTLIVFMADVGFDLCKLQILEIVKNFLIELAMTHIFKDGKPTEMWYYLFLSRQIAAIPIKLQKRITHQFALHVLIRSMGVNFICVING